MSSPRFRLLIALGCVAIGSAVNSDDSKSPGKSASPAPTKPAPAEKAPEFKGYVWVGHRETEVVRADNESITVRVYWPKITSSGRGGRSLGGRGGMSRPNVKVTWEHTDHKVLYLPESLVRLKSLPPKYGDDGKRGYYSAKEQEKLKMPLGAPGYQAAREDLVPGTIIDLQLVRDRSISASKATDADMRVKYAIILRHDPNPPKDIADGTAGKSPAKKK